ncbi:MAG: GTP cyclohydrolase FolE2 [Bdellovibrionales bacterium]
MEIKSLPDVAQQRIPEFELAPPTLKWVGMSEVQMPVRWRGHQIPVALQAQVNLKDGSKRGIHMSRLYQHLVQDLSTNELSWSGLHGLAQKFVVSQEGLSDCSRLQIQMQWPRLRSALKSELSGWRLYPVEMEVETGPGLDLAHLSVEILYSSTCPASSALSREVWKEDFSKKFQPSSSLSSSAVLGWIDSHSGMPAAPHAQRSRARVRVSFPVGSGCPEISADQLIDSLEQILTTPVQTAVKRVDEQEFARLNGQNPMFCEDAARRVQGWLESCKFLSGYHGLFEHQESLHPHNAVAEIESGPRRS